MSTCRGLRHTDEPGVIAGITAILYAYRINIGNMHGFGELDPAADNLFDAGLLAEAGVGFSVVDDGELYLALRYRYSLTELDRNYQENRIKRYIDTFSVAVGYSFRLGGDA